ncbi:cardiolipin synthase [Andreprevotia sp. IGB-42]|uniref:cardiolipin synthase n=1 Tax=Andreprevotia sp. IGB-42 TaxID=2497473 RepID=UPI0035B515CA
MLLVSASIGLYGCSSLPAVVPDLAVRHTPVQLEGAKGTLSVTQSKAVLAKLAASGQGSDILQRHLALEEAIAGSPLTTGNDVKLLQDGPATYQAMYAAIESAQDHINMETYILEDDEVGQRFAEALMAKQRAGVQVNLIYDSVGTLGTPAEFFQKLADSGIALLEFNPVNPLTAGKDWSINQRDHRKLLIVDGRTAFLGGINISSVYSGGSFSKRAHSAQSDGLAWRDTDIQVTGPVVAELQKMFLQGWEKQKGAAAVARNYFPKPQAAGNYVVRAIAAAPDEAYSQIYGTLISAINNAETSVQITNAYFAPDPQLLEALQAAAKRGVKVTLILPSKTDSWLIFHAGRGFYTALLQAGVKIYERHGVILHAKTALIDGVWVTIGSTNLDWRSFLHNYELNAVVLGAGFASQVQAMFDKDLAKSDEITLEKWQNRALDLRFKEGFARIWSYWL